MRKEKNILKLFSSAQKRTLIPLMLHQRDIFHIGPLRLVNRRVASSVVEHPAFNRLPEFESQATHFYLNLHG